MNEPILGYRKGSAERDEIMRKIEHFKRHPHDIPCIINGEEVRTGDTAPIRCPHDHGVNLGVYHRASAKDVSRAIEDSLKARESWSRLPYEERLSVFLKAAALLRGPYRQLLNGATVVGQSKNFFQAEIDSACELIDFWTFNARFASEIYGDQPESTLREGVWNRTQWRPLEGFVFASTPFNFTAIGGNLPTAPVMMGNACLWKPSEHAVLSNFYVMKLLQEAGLPKGVLNFVPGDPAMITERALAHRDLAGVHYTGSTRIFDLLHQKMSSNLATYRSYPRLVGETGGKDFVFAAPDADVPKLTTALIRGAFEFGGQKCSAASRAFVPESLWPEVVRLMAPQLDQMGVGNPEIPTTAVGAVIHEASFNRCVEYLEHAKKERNSHEVVFGGEADGSRGWFVRPTVVRTTDPQSRLLREEIFGPILTVYVYDDREMEKTLEMVNDCEYALTGAIFAQDRATIRYLADRLVDAAGNFYINDKPTGAVVGNQPFGGARKSGNNQKAGAKQNLLNWVSPRTIKETFDAPTHFAYQYMSE